MLNLMKKVVFIFIFVILFIFIYSSLHFFVFFHLIHGLNLSNLPMQLLYCIMIFGIFSFFVGELLLKKYGVIYVFLPAVVWMGFMAISFSIFLLSDLILLFYPFPTFETTLFAIFLFFYQLLFH